MPGRISTIRESNIGRNTGFRDNRTGNKMSRAEFVRKIETGDYPGYHVREINGAPL